MASLYQRKSDGRWVARIHTATGYRYITGVDRDEVVRRSHEFDPATIPPKPLTKDERRFWAKVLRGTNCWLWTGALAGENRNYGEFRVGAGKVGAHRYAYMLTGKVIPEGMELDHLCHNSWCVNPTHMEPVTPRENLRRRLRSGPFRSPLIP